MASTFTIEQTAASVTTIRFRGVSAGWEQWFLLRSDAHHDSPRCNRDLEQFHLDKAVHRNAIILDCGDTFDAMQGKFDPRRNMEDVRSEDAKTDYYDQVVRHAAEFYAPYATNWALFGEGNHESSVRQNTNHDILTSLVDKMHAEGSHCAHGSYGGWVRLMFTINRTKNFGLRIHYYHGSGGDAPVTRGTIQTNRQQVYLPDADIVWNGHSHNSYILPIARARLSEKGIPYNDLCWHIRTPGYKDDYGDGSGGWAVERGMPPKPLGCVWLRLWLEITHDSFKILTEAIQDVS